MAEIAPLTPLRYDLAKLSQGLGSVVAPPYDVIDADQRAALVARDPQNVVQLILPHGEGDTKYGNAATLLKEWCDAGVLIRDHAPGFYRYDQTFKPPGTGAGRAITRRGFLALVKLAPFSDKIVLPHERTLSGPKEDRLKLFRATRTNLSPGFMLYRDPQSALDAPLDTGDVLTEFNTPDGIHHVLAKVTERDAIRAIQAGIAKSQLLIADGHHRYETAVRYRDEVIAATGNDGPKAEHQYFMTFLVNGDDPNLVVFPTHRHVHSLPSFSFDELVAKAKDTFIVEILADHADANALDADLRRVSARGPSIVAATADGRAAAFTLRPDVDLDKHPTLGSRPAVLRRTDVAILHSAILEHILGITQEAQAAKTNIWYPQDIRATLSDLRGGVSGSPKGQVLFIMNPTPVAQVREIAEAGEVMPQKSTFFFPKVLTGLAIHTLDPSRYVPIVL